MYQRKCAQPITTIFHVMSIYSFSSSGWFKSSFNQTNSLNAFHNSNIIVTRVEQSGWKQSGWWWWLKALDLCCADDRRLNKSKLIYRAYTSTSLMSPIYDSITDNIFKMWNRPHQPAVVVLDAELFKIVGMYEYLAFFDLLLKIRRIYTEPHLHLFY